MFKKLFRWIANNPDRFLSGSYCVSMLFLAALGVVLFGYCIYAHIPNPACAASQPNQHSHAIVVEGYRGGF